MLVFVLGLTVGATAATIYWHHERFRRSIRVAVQTFLEEPPPPIRMDR